MNVLAQLLLGVTLALWGASLLGLLTVSDKLIGLLALVTGIIYIVMIVSSRVPHR